MSVRPRFPHRTRIASALGALVLLASTPARAEFPSLEKAIEMARSRALVVGDARGELGAANAQMAGARQSILGNPSSDIQIDRGVSESTNLQILSYTYFPLDIGGQRGKRIDEAERLIEWRKHGVEDARAIATSEVVAVYGEVVVGAHRIIEAATAEQTARDEAKYFAGRFEAKDTTVYEKSLADAEVTRWVQTGAEARLRLTSSRAKLAQLVGAPTVEAPVSIDEKPPALKRPWDEPRIAATIERSPLMVRLRAEKRYWEASVERYERERFPPFSLELILGRGSLGEARVGGGAVITFPVTRRFQGEIARADVGREVAATRAEAYKSWIEARLRASVDSLETVQKTLDEVEKNGLPALERVVGASVEAFKAGKVDINRPLLARRDLAIARARRLDLIEAGWRAYADLVLFSGELP